MNINWFNVWLNTLIVGAVLWLISVTYGITFMARHWGDIHYHMTNNTWWVLASLIIVGIGLTGMLETSYPSKRRK